MTHDLGKTVIIVGTAVLAVLLRHLSVFADNAVRAEVDEFILLDVIATPPAAGTTAVPAGVHHPLQEVYVVLLSTIGAGYPGLVLVEALIEHLMKVQGQGVEEFFCRRSV